jgi:hypothetical protein
MGGSLRSITSVASLNRRLSLFCLPLTILLAQLATAQTPVPPPGSKDLLPANLGDWRAAGEVRRVDADHLKDALADALDGNEAVYREYGLQTIFSREFINNKSRLAVTVYEMVHPSGAFGLLTFERYLGRRYSEAFTADQYYVTVTDLSGRGIDPNSLRSIHERFRADPADEPPLPSHLPSRDRIAGSSVYVVGSEGLSRVDAFKDLSRVVSFAGGAEAAAASYDQNMQLLIIEFHTPQLSGDAEGRLKSYINSLSGEDRAHRQLRRVGNYLAEAVGDPRRADALLNQIRYNPKVYWEGKRLSAIPLAYRPPDAAALEEAAKTARFLLQTFYGIGVMTFSAIALGIVTGAVFFYWRRYRRRRLGLDQYFSDAGGTVRLNLDDYLLAPPEPGSAKLLEKGE